MSEPVDVSRCVHVPRSNAICEWIYARVLANTSGSNSDGVREQVSASCSTVTIVVYKVFQLGLLNSNFNPLSL